MNGYELSRAWFDFCFENPEKVRPNHTAIFFFAIEHCNRLGWKEKFGLPSTMTMEAVGIKSYNTYIKSLNEIIEWGFIIMIQKSKNQYSANIIALSKNDEAPNKALDKAMMKHGSKQSESTVQSNDSIDKPITSNHKPENEGTKKELNKQLLSEIEISDLPENLKEYYQTALSFQKLFIKNLKERDAPTKNQEKAKFGNYVTPIRLMIESDKTTRDQIRKAYDFLKSKEGEFWKTNILSTKKLREKIDVLISQSNAPKKETNGNSNSKSEPTINRQSAETIHSNSKGW